MLHDVDVLIEVVCNHPEDSSMFYTFGINSVYLDDEEQVRKEVEQRVNGHGYWHEVRIWIEEVVDGKVFRHELQKGGTDA